MTLPQALIFDVDGTLADTERDAHRVAFNHAFRDAGLDWIWDPETYGALLDVAGGKERIKHYMDTSNAIGPQTADVAEWIAGLHQSKTRHYTQLLSTGTIPLRPGVGRLIQQARESGIRMAIATTTTPDNVHALLDHALSPGSSAWFEVIAAGDVVAAKKPAPDIYVYALERLGLPPQVCLAFEDSYNGLQSALQVGLRTIVNVNDYTRNQDFTGAERVLSDLGEPHKPFAVIRGCPVDSPCVDLPLLGSMFGQAT
jgi:HAD superfamily hydrolase (TIGR01509 family)